MKIKVFLFLFSMCQFLTLNVHAQYEIIPPEGYTPQIGNLVSMLEDLKGRIENSVKNLDQEETDFLFDENANSIGALIMHLAATEAYYQSETLKTIKLTEEARTLLDIASNLGPEARVKLRGNPISYYLVIWDKIRVKTLEELKKKDDAWLSENIEKGINNHWVWFHVMEHQANHMGQIELVKNRLR